ncbi:hypothetical protein EYC55_07730 [Xanthomonas oryzae]|nr:hypothetical protein EYC55_07730 [Xanthomonas oryzae]
MWERIAPALTDRSNVVALVPMRRRAWILPAAGLALAAAVAFVAIVPGIDRQAPPPAAAPPEEVIYPRNSRNSKGAELELRVPRGAVLQVDAVSAAVDVDQVDLARLRLKSVSGDVIAAGRAKEAQLETVGGALRSTLSSGRTTLGTVSGQLNAPTGASGAVAVESVSGDIRIGAGQVSRLRAQSVSGTTAVTVAGLAPGGSMAAESVSGTITLEVPRNLSAALDVDIFSGDIHSVAGKVQRPAYGPGKHRKATLGAGDVRLESHSGSVRIDYTS